MGILTYLKHNSQVRTKFIQISCNIRRMEMKWMKTGIYIQRWSVVPWYYAKNHSKNSQKSSEESVLGCWLSFWPAPIQVSDAYIKKRHHNQAPSSHSRDISPKKGLTGVISSYRLTFIDLHSYNVVILFPVISSYDFSVSENHIHHLEIMDTWHLGFPPGFSPGWEEWIYAAPMEELSAQWWNDDEEFEGPDCDSTMVCFFFLFGPLLDRVHYNNQGWFGGYCNTTVGRWDYKPTNITRGPHFVGGGSGGVQAFPKGYHVSWPRWMGIWVGRVVYSMPGNMMVHPSWQA